MELVIKIPENTYKDIIENGFIYDEDNEVVTHAIKNGTPLTLNVLADALMEERIRGELDSDTIFEKDVIDNVRCKLTVDIIDHRPCYCGTKLREVWRESEVQDADSN